jgi:hypothetical protein
MIKCLLTATAHLLLHSSNFPQTTNVLVYRQLQEHAMIVFPLLHDICRIAHTKCPTKFIQVFSFDQLLQQFHQPNYAWPTQLSENTSTPLY